MGYGKITPLHDLADLEREGNLYSVTEAIETFVRDFTDADRDVRSSLLIILLEFKPSWAKELLPMPRRSVPQKYQSKLKEKASEMMTARSRSSFEKSFKFCNAIMRRRAAGVSTSKAIEEIAPLFGYDYAAGRNHYYSKRNWLRAVGLEPLIICNMKARKSG